MNIFASGNCQTDQLLAGLQAIAPADTFISGLRHAPGDWPGTPRDREAALTADVFLTHYDPSHFTSWIEERKILRVPDLFFRGFHPDQTALALKSNPRKKLKFSVRVSEHRMARLQIYSALATWAFKRGMSVHNAAKLFRSEVFGALGYFQAFELGYRAMQQEFASLGFDFEPMKKVVHSRTVFMWGVEHPKMALTLCLCESILARLGLDRRPLARDLLIDSLEREYACGCFPPIAEYLGVDGSWAMRIDNVFHPDVHSYISEFFWLLSRFAPEDIQILDRDADVFQLSKMSEVLENFV